MPPRVLTLLSEDSGTNPFSRLFVSAWNNSVHSAPVIPHGNRANLPLPSNRVIVSRMNMIMKELEQLVGLCLFELCKSSDEAIVHVESLESSDRMRADCWMMRINRSTVGRSSPKINNCIVYKSHVSKWVDD